MTGSSAKHTEYVLPAKVESILASVARFLRINGESDLLALLVNSRVEVQEAVDFDNWDGGQTGHAIVFHVPDELFHRTLDALEGYESQLGLLVNKHCHVDGERVSSVRFQLSPDPASSNWREATGALLVRPTLAPASDSDVHRLWGDGPLRVFLSHRADFKVETKGLKDALAKYGAASFVAHEDIEPTRQWQVEIERALATMHVLVAVLTKGAASSFWMNQEVGIALGRGVPVVVLRLAEDPVGFLGKDQGLSGGATDVEWASRLIGAFSHHTQLVRALQDALVGQWERARSFAEGIGIMNLLDDFQAMPPDLLARVEAAYATNKQLCGSGVVSSKYPGFLERVRRASAVPK